MPPPLRFGNTLVALGLLLIAFGCSGPAPATLTKTASPGPSASAHPRAEHVSVRWGVNTNYLDGRFRSTLTLVNRGDAPLGSNGWRLYFNFSRSIVPESLPPGVHISRLNGQLWEMEPTSTFAPVAPGEARRITFEAGAWAIKESDAPAGFYFVFDGEAPAPVGSETVAPFTEERQTDRSRGDTLPVPTPARRYRANAALSRLPDAQIGRITPTPVSLESGSGAVTLDSTLTIYHDDDLGREADYLAEVLTPVLGARPGVESGSGEGGSGDVVLARDDVPVPGARRPASPAAYALSVNPGRGIHVTGASRKGVFYGIQSLRALLPATRAPDPSVTVDAVTVRDAPRFDYRGLHLDVARNFQTKSAVKKLLDLMALYKLNTFHFHLTDDEGWRLPIEELPLLTEVGGRRGHPPGGKDAPREHLLPVFGSGPDPDTAASYGSGFYSREGFEEILRYARERHIDVLPEIEVPGHARAAIVAMEARRDRLRAANRPDAARRYRLQDPRDESEYRSVQGWAGNVVNVCLPSTYRFLGTVIDDVREMYAEAGVPLRAAHVGGDEVPSGAWERSPACERLIGRTDSLDGAGQLQRYFFKRLYAILAERDLVMAGWQEVAFAERRTSDSTVASIPDPYFARRRVRPYVWYGGRGETDNAYRLANAGYEVVMSHASSLYFDMAYDKDPQEAGLYWSGFTDAKDPFAFAPFDLNAGARHAAPLTKAGGAHILGLQGQLWGETLKGQERLEYMAAPPLLSLAERAWAEQPDWASEASEAERKRRLNARWNEFANRLGRRELPRLDRLSGGFAYRLPPPGAVVERGLLHANVAYPGLTIRYATGGAAPTMQSPRYTEPVRIDDDVPVKLRAFSTSEQGSRIVTVRGE